MKKKSNSSILSSFRNSGLFGIIQKSSQFIQIIVETSDGNFPGIFRSYQELLEALKSVPNNRYELSRSSLGASWQCLKLSRNIWYLPEVLKSFSSYRNFQDALHFPDVLRKFLKFSKFLSTGSFPGVLGAQEECFFQKFPELHRIFGIFSILGT